VLAVRDSACKMLGAVSRCSVSVRASAGRRAFSSKISVREALNSALAEELERDEDVFVMGEEVNKYEGAYKVTKGLGQKVSFVC